MSSELNPSEGPSPTQTEDGRRREPRQPAPPKEALLEVGEFDSHGRARAQFNGRPVDVEHGIPGEVVDALVYGKRRRWARIVTIEREAPDRVPAPCPHFHQGCGGCQWQMLSYESQIERKLRNLRDEVDKAQLKADVCRPVTMENPWRYRSTASISLGRHAGFRRHGSQSIVGLDDCPISHELIGELAGRLNRAIGNETIPNFRGEVWVEVRIVEVEGRAALHTCIVPSPSFRDASVDAVMPLAMELARFSRVMGILYRHNQDPPQVLFGEEYGATVIKGAPFAVSAATFFQTNVPLLAKVVDELISAADPDDSDVVVDVYGGAGVFGLLLAPHVSRLIEIEIDPVGIEAAKRSAAMQQLTNVEFLAGTAEVSMGTIGRADTVIVDPPRAGLTPKVIEAIGRLRPQRILYVSCLGSSLVRDVSALGEFGYVCGDIQSLDFYPQTYHLEMFTKLELRRSPA